MRLVPAKAKFKLFYPTVYAALYHQDLVLCCSQSTEFTEVQKDGKKTRPNGQGNKLYWSAKLNFILKICFPMLSGATRCRVLDLVVNEYFTAFLLLSFAFAKS